MNKLKLQYVKIIFNDGSIAVYEDLVNIDHMTLRSNPSETNITVTVTYKITEHEVRHDEDIVYKSNDIKEIVLRWL